MEIVLNIASRSLVTLGLVIIVVGVMAVPQYARGDAGGDEDESNNTACTTNPTQACDNLRINNYACHDDSVPPLCSLTPGIVQCLTTQQGCAACTCQERVWNPVFSTCECQ